MPSRGILRPMTHFISRDYCEQQGWTVFWNKVYDLGPFVPRHPGGDVVEMLKGRNATMVLLNTHPKLENFAPVISKYEVGNLVCGGLRAEEEDYYKLYQDYKARGFFNYKWGWHVQDWAQMLVPLVMAVALQEVAPVLSFILQALSVLMACWYVHDVAHDSVWPSEKQGRRMATIASLLFTGTYAVDYHYIVHRMHHAFTNVLGKDHALETGPIIWDPSQEKRSPKWFRPFQGLAWMGPVLAAVLPAFILMSGLTLVKKRKWAFLALIALRWAFFGFVIFKGNWAMAILSPMLGAYLLGLISSLNHFHLDIENEWDPSFLSGVARTTQSVSNRGYFWDEMMGGLNYHIEHHFFSAMPRRRLPAISADVQALLVRHGHRYQVCSMGECLAAFWKKLNRPFPSFVRENRV